MNALAILDQVSIRGRLALHPLTESAGWLPSFAGLLWRVHGHGCGRLHCGLAEKMTQEQIIGLLAEKLTTEQIIGLLAEKITKEQIVGLLAGEMTKEQIIGGLAKKMTKGQIISLLAEKLTKEEIIGLLWRVHGHGCGRLHSGPRDAPRSPSTSCGSSGTVRNVSASILTTKVGSQLLTSGGTVVLRTLRYPRSWM